MHGSCMLYALLRIEDDLIFEDKNRIEGDPKMKTTFTIYKLV